MPAPSTPLSAKLAAAFGATAAALAVFAGYLLVERSNPGPGTELNLQAALAADPELRQHVIDQLTVAGGGHWDAHNDPDVGRVLRPKIVSEKEDVVYTANRFGMREREYRVPKRRNTVRIVLLGDSFVFGTGSPQDGRFGVYLERYLEQRTGSRRYRPEVLHIGIGSWNLVSECAFLRRQLTPLDPDLVLHLTVPNDLDDTAGVRGYGALASFTPQFRERADASIQSRHPEFHMGLEQSNHLLLGIDYESRTRFERAGDEIRRLVDALGRLDSPYVLVARWPNDKDRAAALLAPFLEPEQRAWFSSEAVLDKRHWLSDGDPHWNDAGQQWAAKLFYALIVERGFLPQLELEPWAEAEALRASVFDVGRAEVLNTPPRDVLRTRPVTEVVDMADARASAAQFNGGVDAEGLVSPYASFCMRNVPGGTVRLEGRALDRPELDGARVRVFADEHPLGSFPIRSRKAIDESWPLPEAVRDREFLSIRLQSDDYVHVGDRLDHCVVFEFRRLSITE